MGESSGTRPPPRRIGAAVGLLLAGAIGAGAAPPADQAAALPTGAGAATNPAPTEAAPRLPGPTVQPIDLSNVLRLAGARDLDIATARQRVCQSLADLQEARGLWLPSLFTGPTYYRLDGQVQSITGQVITTSRSSLFLGSTATLANSFPASPPGSGYPPLNSLSGVLRISDAVYGARAARRVVAANRAGVGVATNNALLAAAEAYFDLQRAAGSLAIAREAAGNAELLADLTGTFSRSGEGLEADHRRALAEVRGRRRAVRVAAGQLEVASANLVRLLVLDPRVVVAPVEPAEAVIRLVPDDVPLDDLIAAGWRGRPELAQAREQVEAAVLRLKQARLRPFVPSLSVSYAGGGFGAVRIPSSATSTPGATSPPACSGTCGAWASSTAPPSTARRPCGPRRTSTSPGPRPGSPTTWSRRTGPAPPRPGRWPRPAIRSPRPSSR